MLDKGYLSDWQQVHAMVLEKERRLADLASTMRWGRQVRSSSMPSSRRLPRCGSLQMPSFKRRLGFLGADRYDPGTLTRRCNGLGCVRGCFRRIGRLGNCGTVRGSTESILEVVSSRHLTFRSREGSPVVIE